MARQSKAVEETPVEVTAVDETVETVEEPVETVDTEVENAVEEQVTETIEEGKEVQTEKVEKAEEEQGQDILVDDAHQSHAEGVAENVTVEGDTSAQEVESTSTSVTVEIPDEDEIKEETVEEQVETDNEEVPYRLNLAVPTVIYRGPHTSLGEKRFCGVVTVLTAADANGFAQVEFVRPGVGLTRGYILL